MVESYDVTKQPTIFISATTSCNNFIGDIFFMLVQLIMLIKCLIPTLLVTE